MTEPREMLERMAQIVREQTGTGMTWEEAEEADITGAFLYAIQAALRELRLITQDAREPADVTRIVLAITELEL